MPTINALSAQAMVSARTAAKSVAQPSASADASAAAPVASLSGADPVKAAQAAKQFEAVVLQSFIQSMLPSNAVHAFGKGTAGDVMKSFLAEHIGRQLAAGSGIGIADLITNAKARVAESAGEPAAAGAPKTV